MGQKQCYRTVKLNEVIYLAHSRQSKVLIFFFFFSLKRYNIKLQNLKQTVAETKYLGMEQHVCISPHVI